MESKRKSRFPLILGIVVVFSGIFWGSLKLYTQELNFHYQKDVSVPAPLMWEKLIQALESSKQSPIWPNQLEVLKAEGPVAPQSRIKSVMNIAGFETEVYFKVISLTPGKEITFQPLNPVYQGLDSIAVLPGKTPDSSQLVWKGNYQLDEILLGTLYFKAYYLKAFFNRFSQKLETLGV